MRIVLVLLFQNKVFLNKNYNNNTTTIKQIDILLFEGFLKDVHLKYLHTPDSNENVKAICNLIN